MLKKYLMFIVVIGSLLIPHAYAEVTTAMYKKNPDIYKMYIAGLGTAYSWANTQLDSEKRRMLYCQPPKLALDSENYVRILNDGIQFADTGLIELTLLNQLMRTFPCK